MLQRLGPSQVAAPNQNQSKTPGKGLPTKTAATTKQQREREGGHFLRNSPSFLKTLIQGQLKAMEVFAEFPGLQAKSLRSSRAAGAENWSCYRITELAWKKFKTIKSNTTIKLARETPVWRICPPTMQV